MERIRLELDYLELERRKERWNVYFVIATELPEDPSKMAISVAPLAQKIALRNPSDNYYSFQGDGDDAEGLMVLRRKMPESFSIRARLWMMHDRKGIRSSGDILSEIGKIMGADGVSKVLGTLGNASPWVVVGKAALGLVGTAMKKVNDRQLGFLTMDEHFNPDGEEDSEISVSKRLSTGYGSIGYSWVIES